MPEKLIYVTDQQLEETDFETTIMMAKNMIGSESDIPKVRQSKDPDDFEPQEWFTNTSNSEYLEEFLNGLALIDKFPSADLCLYKLVDANDDFT